MASPLFGAFFNVFLLLFFPGPAAAGQFHFALGIAGDLWDFGMNFQANLARIALQKELPLTYPNMTVSSELAFLAYPTADQCDPQIHAWGRAGVPVVFLIVIFLQCVLGLAGLYPNTTFVIYGTTLVVPPNVVGIWSRGYQLGYLTGYTAGLMTKSKMVCLSATVSVTVTLLDVAGFSRGVVAADPSVQVHVFGTGLLSAPALEEWIVNQSYTLGCDVVWVQASDNYGTLQASKLGLMSVGSATDARLLVGETVITSMLAYMLPMFRRSAEAVLNGTLLAETRRADWWMGWNWGSMTLADFSFLVPPAAQAKVLAQIPTLGQVFCGHVCTRTQCFCNASTCCLTDAQLNAIDSNPDFVLDHGIVKLPGEACQAGQQGTYRLDTFTMVCTDCPAGTYAFNDAETSQCLPCPAGTFSLRAATACTACPPGTYSDQPGRGQCAACPAGSVASNAASVACSTCSSGLSSSDGTQCASVSLLWLVGVGVGVVAGCVGIGACVLWLARKQGQRNNSAAPKDASQPFCIVFTDIQGSTSLWAAIPEVMAVALDAHHTLIRTLIAKHRCYEVKTIGDSFMCAVSCPAQALRFALAVQETFARHDWGTDRIDQAYAELTPPDIETVGCWNGLRVRAGVHYGYGDIKLDPVSKGYDYYGTVVNTAARIESVCHGGQTGVSAAVYEALAGHCDGAVWADLGPQLLRGLTEPLRLYQVLPEGPLAHRRFPALRTDRIDSKEEALASYDASPPASTSCRDRNSVAPSFAASLPRDLGKWIEYHPLVAQGRATVEDLRRHYHVLQAGLAALLNPLAPGRKQEMVRDLCATFHVPNHGTDAPTLLHTLDGLVKRALPFTVQPQARVKPTMSSPSHTTSRLAPAYSKDESLAWAREPSTADLE